MRARGIPGAVPKRIFLAVAVAALTAVGSLEAGPSGPPRPPPPTRCDDTCERCLQEHNKKDPAPELDATHCSSVVDLCRKLCAGKAEPTPADATSPLMQTSPAQDPAASPAIRETPQKSKGSGVHRPADSGVRRPADSGVGRRNRPDAAATAKPPPPMETSNEPNPPEAPDVTPREALWPGARVTVAWKLPLASDLSVRATIEGAPCEVTRLDARSFGVTVPSLRFPDVKLRNAELRLEVVKCASRDNCTLSVAIPPITLSVIPLLPTKIVRIEPSTAGPGAEFTILLSSAIDALPHTVWSVTVNGENVPVAVVGATLRGRLPDTTGAVLVVVSLNGEPLLDQTYTIGGERSPRSVPSVTSVPSAPSVPTWSFAIGALVLLVAGAGLRRWRRTTVAHARLAPKIGASTGPASPGRQGTTPAPDENEAEAHLLAIKQSAKEGFERNRERGLFVRSLRTTNLPFFGDVTWDLKPGVNVLLGRNGYGKSHLLRLVAALLARETDVVRTFFVHAGPTAKVELELAEGSAPKPPDDLLMIRRTEKVWEDKVSKVPVLAISDTRTFDRSLKFLERQALGAAEQMPEGGAYHFIQQVSNGHAVEQTLFLLCLDYIESRGKHEPLLELLHKTIARLADSGFKIASVQRPNRAEQKYEILVRTEGNEEPVPLRHASQGTLSVLAIFLQIFYFLASLYRSLQSDAKQIALQRAIVIIDEIDAHLHPAWQRHLIHSLREAFPNVQFILSAHSPLVIAGCRSGEVSNLVRDSSGFSLRQFSEDFLGWDPGEILRKVQDVEPADVRYLELRDMGSRKNEFVAERDALQKLERRSEKQDDRLEELDTLLADIGLAEQRASEKLDTDGLELKVAMLEGELRRARQDPTSGAKAQGGK